MGSLISPFVVHCLNTMKPLASIIEPRREKTNVLVSDQVRNKPRCTTTEDSQRIEISNLGRRGIVLSM